VLCIAKKVVVCVAGIRQKKKRKKEPVQGMDLIRSIIKPDNISGRIMPDFYL
jgi:hypothetical protein